MQFFKVTQINVPLPGHKPCTRQIRGGTVHKKAELWFKAISANKIQTALYWCTPQLQSFVQRPHQRQNQTRYPGKGSILPSNWNTQEKMAHFGAQKPSSPSAREAASLKVSIKQGFYLKMYCPHSPLYTLKASMLQTLTVPEPCVALHCSVSVRPPYTEITSRWEDSSLMWTLEEFQVLGKQKLQDQQTLCQAMACHHWSIPTRTFLAYCCSLEKDMLLQLPLHHRAVKISAFPGILLGIKLNIVERALLIMLWFLRQIPKSSRSQIITLKQHYDSEAEVIYLGLIFFTA